MKRLIWPLLALVFSMTTGVTLVWALSLKRELAQRQRLEIETRAKINAADLRATVLPAASAPVAETKTPPQPVVAPQTTAKKEETKSTDELVDEERRLRREAFLEAMADPKISALMLSQRRVQIDTRYADLFRQLNLPPEKIEALKDLLAERQMAFSDSMVAAQQMGAQGRGEIRTIADQARAEIDEKIRQLVGDSGYEAYTDYNRTGSERQDVNRIRSSLIYTSAPLEQVQADRLLSVLKTQKPPTPPPVEAGEEDFASYLRERAAYEASVAREASSFMSQAQIEALKRSQAAEVDAHRLRRIIYERTGTANGGSGFIGRGP